jgi:hypothetical protein
MFVLTKLYRDTKYSSICLFLFLEHDFRLKFNDYVEREIEVTR